MQTKINFELVELINTCYGILVAMLIVSSKSSNYDS